MNDVVTDEPKPQTVPRPLQIYLDVDLSPESDAAKSLAARADAEALTDEIRLSDIVGVQPGDLTPAMNGWYKTFISSFRIEALQAIAQRFKKRSQAGRAEGFLLPCAMAGEDEKLLGGRIHCYKNINERFYSENEQIAALQKDILIDRNRYSDRKAGLGRDAIILNKPLYFSVLFFVVFGSEAAINLDSFSALPWATPAIAWGATILIGLAIGLAAHLHGTLLRQYEYYFGAAEDDDKRYKAWRAFGIGTTALAVALSFVYYARSAYLAAFFGSVGDFGQSSQTHNSLWIIGGSLLGNMLVYLVGTIWAYLLHDSDPDFPELKLALDRSEARSRALKQKLAAARQREIEQLNALYRKKTGELRKAYESIMAQENHDWDLELFARFQAKDAQVLALLENYRGALVQKMGVNAKKVRFIAHCDDPHEQEKIMTVGEYQQKLLKLKYLENT